MTPRMKALRFDGERLELAPLAIDEGHRVHGELTDERVHGVRRCERSP